MKVLFLTLLDFTSIEERGIYTDLLREFVAADHRVYVISPMEGRKREAVILADSGKCKVLKLPIGKIQKANPMEKGITTLSMGAKFTRAIKTYFHDHKFDLVIYTTPPITLQRAVSFVKSRDNAKAYLLLKDIFPQNAVDLGMLKKGGILYKYFRHKEKKLYSLSDYIGCMSLANVDYLKEQGLDVIGPVEVCPNSIEPQMVCRDISVRSKYGIPDDKVIYIYGGNLGKPQGVDFLIECLRSNMHNGQAFFVIVGSGTEFNKLKSFFDKEQPPNARLFSQLPKDCYDILVSACDVGLIFLDRRFSVPNFPSRLLSYMQASLPVLAATDASTDIGEIIEKGNFGYWCKSGDLKGFNQKVEQLWDGRLRESMGSNARRYLEDNYTAKRSYNIIMRHFTQK